MSIKYGVLDPRSMERMTGVHADLVRVVRRAAALSEVAFVVTEGLRSAKRQAALVAAGASRTLNSRHLTGHAVDIAPKIDGTISWDWPAFYPVARAFKDAAGELGVAIVWGGDWRGFKDGPHFELDRKRYP